MLLALAVTTVRRTAKIVGKNFMTAKREGRRG
jgi:hypothetical protein